MPLDTYLHEIRDTEFLTAEEEKTASRDELVLANLPLVVSIAKRYRGHGIELADLIAEGNVGLLEAATRFEPARRVRFCTYATYWIKLRIRDAITNTGRLIRVPKYIQELRGRERRGEELKPKQLRCLRAAERVTNLTEADESIPARTKQDTPEPPNLDILTERERRVIQARFGLDGARRKLREIGAEIGLTKERVRQIERIALRKLSSRV